MGKLVKYSPSDLTVIFLVVFKINICLYSTYQSRAKRALQV